MLVSLKLNLPFEFQLFTTISDMQKNCAPFLSKDRTYRPL